MILKSAERGDAMNSLQQKTKPLWYKMDNAAMIYSAIQRSDYSAVYRFSAVMTQKVDPKALQKAVDKTMLRFPGFRVTIRSGFFWYYMEPDTRPGLVVQKDIQNPCQPVRFGTKDELVRVFYYENRISLEVFHALADGTGALVLLRTLLAVYLRELGHEIPYLENAPDLNTEPSSEEWEDAYPHYADSRVKLKMGERNAYHQTGTPEPFYTLNVTMGLVQVDKLKAIAQKYHASITEYLAAVLIQSLIACQRREKKRKEQPVSLAVPINLRSHFPSKTLRNFILTVRPCIDPELGEYTFQEIISQVHHFMRLHINRQEMKAYITQNVALQRLPLLKIIPSPLKNFAMAAGYSILGDKPYSTTLTNPGVFSVPPEMQPHIQRMEMILGQSYTPRVNCAVISYQNQMTITFAGTLKETDVERDFFRWLVKDGVKVKVISNREEPTECRTV